MLKLVDSRREKIRAHNRLQDELDQAWQGRETRKVVWRPDSRAMKIIHNGEYWFGSQPPQADDTTPRFWDPYGKYREKGSLHIAVEINISTLSNDRRIAGFFAADSRTDALYLMHDGAVGGGQKGVGREAFLQWSSARLVPVVDALGNERPGVIVTRLGSDTLGDDIARFVKKVRDF